MAVIAWQSKYNVGVRKIDQQHRRIVDVLNELYDLQESNPNNRALEKVFATLRTYIQEHFETEEAYIALHDCPRADLQRSEHEQFVDKICAFQKDFLKQKPMAVINLFNYIWDWFAHHIIDVDKKCLSATDSV